jgi:hypothetical protein
MTWICLLISATPMVVGIAFAIRPSEQRLALMRPLTLAGIFAGVCNLMVGLANSLRGLAAQQTLDAQSFRIVFPGLAESVIVTFVASACLTVAWLCVAMGMRKTV